MTPFTFWLTFTGKAARAWLLALDAMWDVWIPLEHRFTPEEREKLEALRERVQQERVEG